MKENGNGRKEIIFWCETLFGFYSLKPIYDYYKEKNYNVIFYTCRRFRENATNYFGLTSQNIRDIEDIDGIIPTKLHRIFLKLCVPHDFSSMYKRARAADSLPVKIMSGAITRFIDKKNINAIYSSLFKRFSREFEGKTVLSMSRVSKPFLVCSPKIRHISVMESWDHPVKAPYFFIPSHCLTWNESLKNDLEQYQGFRRISEIGPLKFRYIFERQGQNVEEIFASIKNKEYVQEIAKLKSCRPVMYPCTTSSINPSLHEGEIKLLDCLCRSFENNDKILYIKPKPNGNRGDYDQFRNRKNVIVGLYSSSNSSIDMLDEDYQSFRYLILHYSEAVINWGTTFVLEAALMDKKIVQLILNEKDFGRFGACVDNEHLKKYLFNEYTFPYSPDGGNIAAMTENGKNCLNYSRKLKEWIVNKNSRDNFIDTATLDNLSIQLN